jgi:hypothetical protein
MQVLRKANNIIHVVYHICVKPGFFYLALLNNVVPFIPFPRGPEVVFELIERLEPAVPVRVSRRRAAAAESLVEPIPYAVGAGLDLVARPVDSLYDLAAYPLRALRYGVRRFAVSRII